MTLGPTRQLLTTGKRLLQLSQQLEQSTNLAGLASVYAGLTVDPLTRLDHQLQGIPIEDNGVPETLGEPTTVSWGPEFTQSTTLSVKPGFDPTFSIKPSSSAAPSLSSTLEQVSFSKVRQPERVLSPVAHGHSRINDQTIAGQSSSPHPSTDLATPATVQASTSASQLFREDRLSSVYPPSNDSSVNLQADPSAAPIPQSSFSTIPKSESPTQTENFQTISPRSSLSTSQATSQPSSPLRMIQSSNKLASILKTQLAPLPTASDQPSFPEPSSSPDISFPAPSPIPTPAPAQAVSLDITENLDDYSPTTTHPQFVSPQEISYSPPVSDSLTLDTLVDAVAERLEFDRLRLYGTSSL